MRLLVCAVARVVATRTGYHAYTRARTDDKHHARRNPFYYTSSWVVPHRHQAPASHPSDPAGTLEQDSENLSILTARYYHIHTTTSRSRLNPLRSTRSASNVMEEGALVAQFSSWSRLFILLSHSQRVSPVEFSSRGYLISVRCARSDDGWMGAMDKEMHHFKSHGTCELAPHVPGMRTIRIGYVLHWHLREEQG